MKLYLLFLAACFTTLCLTSFGQNNTFPNNGNVGIGTMTPSEKLDINGNLRLQGTYPYISFLGGSWGSTYIQQGINSSGSGSGNYLGFMLPAAKGFSFAQGSVEKMVISTDGNVGIGTTTPSFPLSRTGLTVRGTHSDGAEIIVQPVGATNGTPSGTVILATGDDGYVYNRRSGKLTLGTNDVGYLTIASSGKVGIGINNPTSDLQIERNASGASDYVNVMIKNTVATSSSNAAQLNFNVVGGGNGSLGKTGTGYSSAFGIATNDFYFLNGNNGDIVFSNTVASGNIRFITGGGTTTQMALLPSGNVGVGTTTPSEKLSVSGNVSLTSQTNAYQISYAALSETTSGASTILGNNVKAGASNNTIKRFANGSDAGSYISLNYLHGITFHTGISSALNTEASAFNNEVMRITQGANIGIGTTTPYAKLDVNGNIKSTGFILPTGAANGKVLTSDASGNGTWQTAASAGWSYDGNTVGVLKKIGTTDNYALPFITNNTEWMRITTSGNIGIGTTSPSEKLSVNGNVRSKKSIVTQSGWADYVFNKDYKLPSLKEVESYIQLHKHLPEIPSAAEVEKNGLDLGDMSKNLLKKIEELTLYMIDMKKENEELNKKVNELERAINGK